MGRFRANLTVQILTGVVAVFVALCGVVSYIGYCEFTEALEAQYESKAFGTALTAAADVKPEFLTPENIPPQEQQLMFQLPTQERPIGGLGIYMVKKTMDSVAYEHKDGQNIFTMRKTI